MVGIYGINGLPEPATNTPESTRGKRSQARADVALSTGQDQVSLSPEAQQASTAVRLAEAAKAQSEEIRSERVAEARERLEQGTYRIQEVVLAVAARVRALWEARS